MANIMGLSTTVENLRERNTSLRVQAEMSAHMSNGFSVIGISAPAIPTMQSAIREYVAEITSKLNQLDTEYNPDIAFKGTEIYEALKNYMSEAKQISLNIVTYLNAFSDQLDEIRKAYEANDSSNASNINNQRSSLQGSYNGAYQSAPGEASGSYHEGEGLSEISLEGHGPEVVAYPGHPNGQ